MIGRDCLPGRRPGSSRAWRFPSHAFAFEVDAVCVVDDPVEDGVSDGGFADEFVPFGDGER